MRFTMLFVMFTCSLFLVGCELLNEPSAGTYQSGQTYDYLCAAKADELAQESAVLVQKMHDMGCQGLVSSDALYARCVELGADNNKIIREWNALSCTDDSKAPVV